MAKYLKLIVGLAAAITSAGCVPNYFDGVAAVLDDSQGITVAKEDRSWGDCYLKVAKMPTVYQIKKSNYMLVITHGQRYWPELFLEARSPQGEELQITGQYIEEVQYRSGGDMRRLREARGTDPSHKTVDLSNVAGNALRVDILDESGNRLGRDDLSFKLQNVKCMETDSV